MVDKFARYYSNLYILDALFIQESAGGGGAGAGSANGDLPKMFSPVALQFNEQQFNAILYLRSVLTGFGLDSNLW